MQLHLPGLPKEISGGLARVRFVQRLQDEKKFLKPEPMATQMRKDVNVVRAFQSDYAGGTKLVH
jgi:FAD synthase